MHYHSIEEQTQLDLYIRMFKQGGHLKLSTLNAQIVKSGLKNRLDKIFKLNAFSNKRKHYGLDVKFYSWMMRTLNLTKESKYSLVA